jgi:protoporphyrinogen oxidase|tara:strand:+ start:809 stop:1063 length:255 start_codon:yes stop_codon:yes gene_type:complete
MENIDTIEKDVELVDASLEQILHEQITELNEAFELKDKDLAKLYLSEMKDCLKNYEKAMSKEFFKTYEGYLKVYTGLYMIYSRE